MPSVTKRKVVPPSMVTDARGWLVSTKTGVWYGGLSPHQPFQVSSGQAPRMGPNMFRPRIHAPMPVNPPAAKSSSTPVAPPSPPNICRNVRVAKAHLCNATPPMPSGLLRSWLGPAPYPSRDIVKLWTRSLDMDGLVLMIFL